MSAIEIANAIEASLGPIPYAGTPADGTSETQTLTLTNVTGGTFTITFDGFTTAAITWSATTSTLLSRINTALRALPNVGGTAWTATDINLSGGNGTLLLTASGVLGALALPTCVANGAALTGTSVVCSIAETTPGVTATARGAATGARLVDTTTGNNYTNEGTALAPDWDLVSDVALTIPQAAITAASAATAVAVSATAGSAVTATVSTNIAAFTDPPSAAEMALLRTFVNALKTDAAAIIVLLNALRADSTLLVTQGNALVTDAASIRTKLNTALTELATAGVIS